MKVHFDGEFMTMIAENEQDLEVFRQIKLFQDKTAAEESFWNFGCFDLEGQNFSMTQGEDQMLLAVEYI